MCNSVCVFGYNGFAQIAPESTRVIASQVHSNVKRILLATWEVTIVLTEENVILWWGHASESRQQLCDGLNDLPAPVHHVFGDINTWLGAMDAQGTVWYTFLSPELSAHVKWQQLASDAQDVVHCPALCTVFVLTASGHVDSYTVTEKTTPTISFTKRLTDLPRVHAIAASATHVLFATGGLDPVYALGSNRFSQLGLDTSTAQMLNQCTPIEFFSGMGMMTVAAPDGKEDGDHAAVLVACGMFHSAVVLAGELYTFGWKKDGRLGWHQEDEDDVIAVAVFLDDEDRPVEVHIVSVACGAAHTLAIDDQGHAWSCGSNKYGQLGRSAPPALNDDEGAHEGVFRRCTVYQGTTKNCYAGRWSSFLNLS